MPAGSQFCIAEGMLSAHLVRTLVGSAGGVCHYSFQIRNQFLHPNHPLGWIRRMTVALNNIQLDPGEVHFVLRGQQVALSDVPTISDIWWYMREVAQIHFRAKPLPPGRHEVQVGFDVSTFSQTPAIDRKDRHRTLHQSLSANLELAI